MLRSEKGKNAGGVYVTNVEPGSPAMETFSDLASGLALDYPGRYKRSASTRI